MKVQTLPREDYNNGWSAIIPCRTPKPSLKGINTADWVIIGAGNTGLAAARALAALDNSQKTLVLEAVTVGDNSAGKRTGFVSSVPRHFEGQLAKPRVARRYKRLLETGLANIEETIHRWKLDCQWTRPGIYHWAVSKQVAVTQIQRRLEKLDCIGQAYEYLEGDTLSRRLGTNCFKAAIYMPVCASVNPAAFIRGLADSLPSNVQLHENSPVIDIKFGKTITITTPSGVVRTNGVILTANALAFEYGLMKSQPFQLVSFGSLSRPLSPAQRACVGNIKDWSLSPATAIEDPVVRYTDGNRLFISEIISAPYGFPVSKRIEDNLRERQKCFFNTLFPRLKNTNVEHSWLGPVNITRSGSSVWGRFGPNVYVAVGCNDVGIVQDTIAGVLISNLALGVDNPLIVDFKAIMDHNSPI